MSFERALAEARASPRDPGRLEQLARQALDHGEEERALSVFRSAPVARSNARTMQWRGLLERALDRLDDAVGSFEAAAALAPADPGIAHGLARATLEAGWPAEARFERALQLAPQDSQVLAGLVAARLAGGHGEQGERELAAIVARHPAWIDGHMQLAQLRSMLGKSDSVAASLETALAAAPRNADLWFALFARRSATSTRRSAAPVNTGSRPICWFAIAPSHQASSGAPTKRIGCSSGGMTGRTGSGASATCCAAAVPSRRLP